MDSILSKLPRQNDPNVLIGFETADDAGVYQLAPDLALVQTVDFFTPIVDDPYTFGQIAAANSLSDVYAMGGRPISALSIVGFPNQGREVEILESIIRGGLEKMQEANCPVIGGHSIGDEEIKFGYAVTGVIHPNRVFSNAAARPGDRLLLSKPLGTGIISTALKRGQASDDSVRASVASMLTLNRKACELMLNFEVHSVTDVTGYGLLGHGREMALASQVSLVIDHRQVEFLPEALDYSRQGHLPGGLKNNREFLEGCVEFSPDVAEEIRSLLYDPQTSGGLLLAVASSDASCLHAAMRTQGLPAQLIGEVVPKTKPLISVQ